MPLICRQASKWKIKQTLVRKFAGSTRYGPFILEKHLGIFLLFSLIAPLAGTYTWLHYEKQQVRKEIKKRLIAGIDRSELVLIKLSRQKAEAALEWEHEREFEYRGHMYDVVETRIQNDTFLYWCWPDNAETRLNKKLDRLLTGALEHDPQRRETERHVVQFFKSLYFVENSLPAVTFNSGYVTRPSTGFLLLNCFSITPQTPPPEMV